MHPFSRMAILLVAVLPVAAGPCESLTSLAIPNTTVTSAAAVEAGAFTPPGPGARGDQHQLPAFCRVLVTSKPVDDSEIHFELWLPPADSWNRKFEGTGNGGFSSAIGYRDMARALTNGYATAGSDTGHEGGDLKFGVGHPEKINDWAYRAVHVMTDTAKLIVRDYYGRLPQYSYFNGCSTGGHQALTEAQRFPGDYDGIVAGDPGNNRITLIVGFLWSWLAIHKDPANPLPASKLPMVNKAVVAACDAIDGLKDGIIDDPRRCKFDPGALLCKGGDGAKCLTAPQVDAVRKYIRCARIRARASGSSPVGPGGFRDRSRGWSYFVGARGSARTDFWRLWVFNDPNWDCARSTSIATWSTPIRRWPW